MAGGRPTKFTPDVKERLFHAIRKGAPYTIACDYAGISYELLRQWRMEGNVGEDPEFVEFLVNLKKAEGETALKWLDVIENAMPENWQAAAWKLERRHFSEFSSNPVVREEMKYITDEINKLKSQNGDNGHGKEAKEMDSEGDQTSGSFTPGATCT